MRGIILAAGRGSRMTTLTDDLPKCLVQLKNKPLLSYQIEALQAAHINNIGVVCGYAQHKIVDPRITHKFENAIWQSSNMVRSLMSAEAWLCMDDCLISYADIFYDSAALTALRHSPANIALTYDRNFLQLWSHRFKQPLQDLETFAVDAQGFVCEIGNKPASLHEIQGQYMGLLKITPQGWQQITQLLRQFTFAEINQLDMTGLLKHLVAHHIPIQAVAFEGQWGEVDSPSDLALYETW